MKMQNLLESKFIDEKSQGIKILSFSWLRNQDIPTLKFLPNQIYDGMNNLNVNSHYDEEWINFNVDRDNTIFVNYFTLNKNGKLFILMLIFLIFIHMQ